MLDIRTSESIAALPVAPQRIRSAHEQVRDQLRAMIVTGGLARDQRLPNETTLASEFGVSRGTIREALRAIASEGLIRTTKGNGGGSFVTLPTVGDVSELLQRNVELLSMTADVTLAQFLEARKLIECFTVRHAAAHRTDEHLERLRATLTTAEARMSPEEQYLRNRAFHSVLVDICGNALLKIAAQPIFSVLHTHMQRSLLSEEFPRRVCAEHAVILEAIEQRDADRAEALMDEHLAHLAGVYERIWQPGGTR
jgi:GntR family transcriptional repressor for pyruvate dehydrogenase complex